jgi:chemotaxis protein CheX
MTPSLTLPRVLDLSAASRVKAAILERRGEPVVLDASEVERLGGLCVQVLLAARAEWRMKGHELRIERASDAFVEAAQLMAAHERLVAVPE